MKKTVFTASLTLLCATLSAQEKIDSTVISAFRADDKTPVAADILDRDYLEELGADISLPAALSLQPSTVVLYEGGTGLGNSVMRVRGSDATRTNVTLNGVTLNDAESQQVFWVNIPAISGFLESVQLQRGVGTSSSGPGAFGASVNMQTRLPGRKYARAEFSGGSFLTGTVSAALGSGRLENGFSMDGGLFCGSTEGYIDNGFVRALSTFASGGWMKGNNAVKFNYILGAQRSGITWLGCPPGMLEKDRRYNPAHKGDSDNYAQNHFQGIYIHQFESGLFWTTTLNYTRGGGYYNTFLSSDGPQTELCQAESNNYWAVLSNITWRSPAAFIVANVSGSLYDGEHHNYNRGPLGEIFPQICRSDALKRELSAFVRGEFSFGPASLYGEVQLRGIDYSLSGRDDCLVDITSRHNYIFFNPKLGLTLELGKVGQICFAASVGNKEPNRADIIAAIDAGDGKTVGRERLYDFELGWKRSTERFSAGANLYLMEYRDQLLENGRLSADGYRIRENVPRSHRRGVELTFALKAARWLRLDANASFSVNRIEDNGLHMTLSPGAVGMVSATFAPTGAFSADFSWKYVGSQYYDNTQSAEKQLPAYDVWNVRAEYSLKKVKFAIFVNNLLNRKYIADAWSDGVNEGFFPQAGINVNIKTTIDLQWISTD